MELKHLNEQEFNTVKNGTKTAMIDFFATWCGPCKMLGVQPAETYAQTLDKLL